MTGVTALSAGIEHSLALRSDGTVWAWGGNAHGQLGDGTTTQRTTPVQVSGLTGITAIATGGGHGLAVRNDGTVWAWGSTPPVSSGMGRPRTASRPSRCLG